MSKQEKHEETTCWYSWKLYGLEIMTKKIILTFQSYFFSNILSYTRATSQNKGQLVSWSLKIKTLIILGLQDVFQHTCVHTVMLRIFCL